MELVQVHLRILNRHCTRHVPKTLLCLLLTDSNDLEKRKGRKNPTYFIIKMHKTRESDMLVSVAIYCKLFWQYIQRKKDHCSKVIHPNYSNGCKECLAPTKFQDITFSGTCKLFYCGWPNTPSQGQSSIKECTSKLVEAHKRHNNYLVENM